MIRRNFIWILIFVLAHTAGAQTWAPVGTGMNNFVRAMMVYNSTLYAGGFFTSASGVANTFYVASWNGSAWSPLATGVGGSVVRALAVNGTTIYAGGNFSSPGSRIAKYSAGSWSAMGTGINGLIVYALCSFGGNLYAAGNFTDAGGVANTANIARWTGAAWQALGGSGPSTIVYALATDGSYLYVGGSFGSVSGVANTLGIARYNGSAWSEVGGGLPAGAVYSMASDGTNIYIGGQFTGTPGDNVAKWNGSSWSAMGTGTNGIVTAMAAGGGSAYAGGGFTTAGGVTVKRVAKWDGSAWSDVTTGTGMASEVDALAVYNSDLYAGGQFGSADGVANTAYIASIAVTLPLELTSFTGKYESGKVYLNWTAASEQNLDYFIVERSTDGKDYTSIGLSYGSGYSSASSEYSFVDNAPLRALAYYRLREVDFDGKNTCLKAISVSAEQGKIPVTVTLRNRNILLQPSAAGHFCLYNTVGEKVLDIILSPGREVTADAASLPAGLYFYRFCDKGSAKGERLILQ